MKNKVYYGEYSLKHWIELILKGNIILPEYQRSFVWNEDMVNKLIATFNNNQFVPPVTIGAFNTNDKVQNYILDGQQRLTSIFLSYLGLYPNKESFKYTAKLLAAENDEEIEEDDMPVNKIMAWTLNELTQFGGNRDIIKKNILASNYKIKDYGVEDAFFEANFLGFSYLVPFDKDRTAQQKYYSSVFRDINIQGKRLLDQESRKSLYFLDDAISDFFEPDFCDNYTLSKGKLDFVRIVSLLSQFNNDCNTGKLARGYKPIMEKYYEMFIYSVVNKKKDSKFGDMSNISKPENFKARFVALNLLLCALLGRERAFISIIETDIYFFGLIYYVVFLGKQINLDKKDEIIQEIEAQIKIFKDDSSHSRSPAALKYLKQRLDRSVEIYKKYQNE